MKKTMYWLTSVIVTITLTLGSFSAVGASPLAASKTYYVSLTGSDTNAGTATAPFKTFTKAVSMLVAGDVLQVYGGTYTQQLNVKKSGTAAAPITVQPVAGQKVIIDGGMTLDRDIILSGSYINISGFETVSATDFCVDVTGSNISVKNFYIHNCFRFGARIKGKYVTFEGSTLHSNVLENTGGVNTTGGWAGTLRVGLGGENITLKNNTIYNNYGEGIGVGQGRFVNIYNNVVHDNYSQNIYVNNSTDVNVENNFVYSVDPTYYRSGAPANCIGMADEYYSGWGAQLARVRVINNIAAFCKRGIGYTYSENTDGGMDTVTIAYNTVWGSTEAGIVAINQPTKTRNSVISNNIVQQSDGRLTDIQVGVGISYSNNFWVSPAKTFKSGSGDKTGDVKLAAAPGLTFESFRLSSSSPAIAGAVSMGVAQDFAGNSRGPSYDMGALQFTGIVSATATAAPALPTATQPIGMTATPTRQVTATSTPIWGFPTAVPSATKTATPVVAPSTATATPIVQVSPTFTPTGVVPTATVPVSTQPSSETVFDDKNGNLVYSVGWSDVAAKQAYGGSYKQTTQSGSTVSITFTGQSFSVLYKGGPSYRKMDVFVDGALVATLDENLTVSTYQPRWDYPGQLAAGTHTLMLVFVSTPGVANNNGSVDAVIVR
ncbi:MAG TPA: right-handed parallel beta-helix repeat-containing protein [Anaerolineales bacterium]|nr:right-handed parallel beta-helix repeat-containing protein [Anaerolineales bacterium]HND93223.1 right-handed parallel beta-helix repeat-containing protein [Anaerolineales bacterium]